MTERYGGNPMFNAVVKAKHQLGIDRIDTDARTEKMKATKQLSNLAHGRM